jgi:hypothetical protein
MAGEITVEDKYPRDAVTFIPSRKRAASLDPMSALRTE